MKHELTPFLSRLLALAILGVLCVTVYGLVLQPTWTKYRNYRESGLQATELLVKYRRVAADLGALQSRLIELRGRRVAEIIYLEGASDALAAAGLQNHLKAVVTSMGGVMKSTQILPVRDEGDFIRIAIRAQLSGHIEPLQSILYNLESGKPFVFIDNVDIRRRKTRRRQDESDTKVELDMRFDLYGYMRRAES